MQSGTWTWFEHTADIGIEVSAPSLETLFSTAAIALFDLLIETDQPQTTLIIVRAIAVDAGNPPELLVRWLAELLFLHETEHLVLKQLEIETLSDERITGVVYWERFDERRHRVRREIKGITYHQVSLREEPSGWRARVIVDV